MTEKPYNSVDEYISEHIAADAIPTWIGRGIKKIGASAARNMLGMRSMDQVMDGQNGRAQLVNDFIGYARQQGWPKTKYTMAMMLAFFSQRYQWMPDDESMLQIADYAKKTWGQKRVSEAAAPRGKKVDPNELTMQEKTALRDAQVGGHMGIITKAVKGNNLTQTEVRALGGWDKLELIMHAVEKLRGQPGETQTAPQAAAAAPAAADAPAADGAAPAAAPAGAPAGAGQPDAYKDQQGSFAASPEDHRAKWQRLQKVLPGRDNVLLRGQMDNIAMIVARDMLRRNLMVRPENAENPGKEKSEKTVAGNDARRNPSRDSVSPSGSMVSIREFLTLAREGGAPMTSLKELEILGEKSDVREVHRAALNNPSLGERRLRTILAAFAMSFRLKTEQRRTTDLPYNSNNQYVACRALTLTFVEEGVTGETMEEFNKIGESSKDIVEVARQLSTLGSAKLDLILGCLAKSMRIMSEAEMKQVLNGSGEEAKNDQV